jgi:hypothetical protein
MSLGGSRTSPRYAASGDRGAVGTPAANRGSLAMSFTPSKPGNGLCAFADNASVTVVNPASDALTAAAVLEVPPTLNAVTLLLQWS